MIVVIIAAIILLAIVLYLLYRLGAEGQRAGSRFKRAGAGMDAQGGFREDLQPAGCGRQRTGAD